MNACQQGFRRRQTFGVGRRQIDDHADDGLGGVFAAANAEAADFDQARQLRRRPDRQLIAVSFEMDPIVANQDRRRELPGAPGQDEIEGEPRFTGSRGAADQYRPPFDQHGGSVEACMLRHSHGVGSRTTKRAPATVASPSVLAGPARFSAQMRPPWASMICFEIDNPSPEFCPKPWCGRSV
jgi:hypothetical protein